MVRSVATVDPDGEQSQRLADRTDGNPFFLVEYARLAREGGNLTDLLEAADPPTAVTDVISRRLARLPDDTRAMRGGRPCWTTLPCSPTWQPWRTCARTTCWTASTRP